MQWIGPRGSHVAAAFLVLCCSCEGGAPGSDSGDEGGSDADARDEREGDGDADGSGDAEASASDDADAESHPLAGPLTVVIERVEMTTDRACDHDGDGLGDNVIADLGSPAGELLASFLSATLALSLQREHKFLLHSPWVEDLRSPHDPSITLISFTGPPDEYCRTREWDPSDDFSGEETYCIDLRAIDGCGEPLTPSDEASIDEGVLGAHWSPMLFVYPLSEAWVTGPIEPGGRAATLSLCGYSLPSILGDQPGGEDTGDLSALELMLAGGAPSGFSTVPGVTPDLDRDGDGLERYTLDEDFHLSQCIDGDGTILPGRDCWRDERMADGFSMAGTGWLVPALLGEVAGPLDAKQCARVLGRVEQCRTTPCLREQAAKICPRHADALGALLACHEERCSAVCPPGEDVPDSFACRTCAEAECSPELTACLEHPEPCCVDPPETSLWTSR